MRIDVTWRLILGYTLCIALLLLLVCSCGTRKVASEKEKEAVKEKVEESSTGNVKKEENNSESTKDSETNNDVADNLKKTITELYWENGQLKSRITTLEKSKLDKTSTKQKESLRTSKNTIDSTFTNKIYRDVVITRKHTVKESDANNTWVNNVGGWGVILGITVIVVGAIFLYFYLKK